MPLAGPRLARGRQGRARYESPPIPGCDWAGGRRLPGCGVVASQVNCRPRLTFQSSRETLLVPRGTGAGEAAACASYCGAGTVVRRRLSEAAAILGSWGQGLPQLRCVPRSRLRLVAPGRQLGTC